MRLHIVGEVYIMEHIAQISFILAGKVRTLDAFAPLKIYWELSAAKVGTVKALPP